MEREKETIEKISQCIKHSLFKDDSDELANAYSMLENELPKYEDYLPCLLKIGVEGPTSSSDYIIQIRKAACIILFKEIESNWKPTPLNDGVSYRPEVKQIIRANILEGMKRSRNAEILRLLSHCLHKILCRDFPQEWLSFEIEVYNIFKSENEEDIFVGLSALHALEKIRQNFIGGSRNEIESSIGRFMPLFVNYIGKLTTNLTKFPNKESSASLQVSSAILKIVYRWIAVLVLLILARTPI